MPVALINGSGQLTGTTGLVVGAVTYNVSFVEGSCISLFGGYATPASLDVSTFADAKAATQALFDQIVSGFGNNPNNIFGCAGTSCSIFTPGDADFFPALTVTNAALVMISGVVFGVGSAGLDANTDTSGNRAQVYTDWAATLGNGVPEPGSLALLGLGIAALG